MTRYAIQACAGLLLLSLVACSETVQPAVLEWRTTPATGAMDLYQQVGNTAVNLTQFDRPMILLDHATSPDHRYLFVACRVYGPPEVQIFDLNHHERISQWTPHPRARITWIDTDQLNEQWTEAGTTYQRRRDVQGTIIAAHSKN